jgi:hypothetical protein
VKEIARAGQKVFANAGTDLGKTVPVYRPWTVPSSKGKERELEAFRMRERTVVEVRLTFFRAVRG